MKLSRDEAISILEREKEGWETIYDQIIDDKGRWTNTYEIVFKNPEGKFFMTYYRRGATEYQEEEPWEYEKEVEFTEVERKEVITIKYVKVQR